jgi:hypothetical protein
VTIPSNVTSIGNYAFNGCTHLTSVIFGPDSNITTAWDSSTFTSSSGGYIGDSLWTAYTGGTSKAGTYTRSGDTWTQE